LAKVSPPFFKLIKSEFDCRAYMVLFGITDCDFA